MQETIEISQQEENKTPTANIKKVKSLDFNCDLAQSFGVYENKDEFKLLDYVSSVNISTGFHAGDPNLIKKALLQAKEKNVVIGAHIGFDDIQGYGNRPMLLSDEEVETLVIYQVGALMSFAKAYGLEIEHVRPHGAMYKMASENFTFACAIAKAVKKCSQWLVYCGASGDVTAKVGEYVQIPVSQEVKLERLYTPAGNIDYTSNVILGVDSAMRRLQNILRSSQVDNNLRGYTALNIDSIHFSVKHPHYLELAKRANELITPVPVNYNKAQSSGWV